MTNYTGETKKFTVRAIDNSGSYDLAESIRFIIKSKDIVIWEGSLLDFLTTGKITLAELPDGGREIFDLTAVFLNSAGNYLQEKSIKFDLEFGIMIGTDNLEEIRSSECGNIGGAGEIISKEISPHTLLLPSFFFKTCWFPI